MAEPFLASSLMLDFVENVKNYRVACELLPVRNHSFLKLIQHLSVNHETVAGV